MSRNFIVKFSALIVLFLSIQIYNVKSFPAFYFESTIFSDTDEYFLHTVERGQNVFGIAKMYQVPKDSIYKLNPGSENGIQAGSQLKIPQISGSYVYHEIQPKETLYSVSKSYYMKGEDIIEVNPGLSEKTFTIGKIIRIPVNRVTQPIEGSNENKKVAQTNALLSVPKDIKGIKTVEIAVLLPFEGGDNGLKRRIIEYYEGFLLAIDSLKRVGVSINIQVYDTGTGTIELAKILKKPEMQGIHLIIGGFSDEQIKLISAFSRNNEIPYVIPFTSRSDEPMYNPYVFQVNTPHSYLYSKVSLAFCSEYKDYKVIFIKNGKDNEKNFVSILQNDLGNKGIVYESLTYGNNFSRDMNSILNGTGDYVIIPEDSSQEFLSKILPVLQTIAQTKKSKSIILFGYPEWQRYGHELLSNFFYLNTNIYSVFYANSTSPELKNFYSQYRKWYSKNPLESYPKYSILGFDTGMYFIKAINQFGESMISNLDKVKYKGIQTDFEFERVNVWGGFINTNVYFVNFNNNYTISKKSIQ